MSDAAGAMSIVLWALVIIACAGALESISTHLGNKCCRGALSDAVVVIVVLAFAAAIQFMLSTL